MREITEAKAEEVEGIALRVINGKASRREQRMVQKFRARSAATEYKHRRCRTATLGSSGKGRPTVLRERFIFGHGVHTDLCDADRLLLIVAGYTAAVVARY